MKKILVFLVVCLAHLAVFAQQSDGNQGMSFKRGSFSTQYYIGSEEVSYNDFVAELGANSGQPVKMFKSGKSLGDVGTVIGTIGAFFFGYDLGGRLAGGKGNTGMLVGGGSATAVGVILSLIGERKMKNALTLYGNDNNKIAMKLNVSQQGLGLCLNF